MGYMLYESPGIGMSSVIAAMANYLSHDIYDLELTEVHSNFELRKLVMKTISKLIIVIEDIDAPSNCRTGERCDNFPLENHDGNIKATITLSGLLKFMDGLWSWCGSKRIFVFTTNHTEKLDPALLRSGRMDMHIHMSYYGFGGLKILLKNYLGIDDDMEYSLSKELCWIGER